MVVNGTVDPERLTDELLRHDTSVMGLYRRATRDTEIGGVAVPCGASVWVSYGAANRDPAKFEAPDELCCQRDNARQNLTFGFGAHYCVGPLLARLQLREAVTRAARHFPDMRLIEDEPLPEVPTHGLRALFALPVLLA